MGKLFVILLLWVLFSIGLFGQWGPDIFPRDTLWTNACGDSLAVPLEIPDIPGPKDPPAPVIPVNLDSVKNTVEIPWNLQDGKEEVQYFYWVYVDEDLRLRRVQIMWEYDFRVAEKLRPGLEALRFEKVEEEVDFSGGWVEIRLKYFRQKDEHGEE